MVGDVGYDAPHQTEATMDARNLHHDHLGVSYQREELRRGGGGGRKETSSKRLRFGQNLWVRRRWSWLSRLWK